MNKIVGSDIRRVGRRILRSLITSLKKLLARQLCIPSCQLEDKDRPESKYSQIDGKSKMISEFQSRIEALSTTLSLMESTTKEANRCCELLTRRTRQLDSLTSPASDASQRLTRASQNLLTTLTLMKDSREKFDTVADCEPSIKRLYQGATNLIEARKKEKDLRKGNTGGGDNASTNNLSSAANVMSEQDVYSAADSMDIIRDAYSYFLQRKTWRSTPSALGGLERVHQLGVDAMCLLVQSHFTTSGPAIKIKETSDNSSKIKDESAVATRKRISNALHNRELMKFIGEYEEFLPLDTRSVRELRAIFECLGSGGHPMGGSLPNAASMDKSSLRSLRLPTTKVVRTEKIGSGFFTNLAKAPLKTGFPHLNAYGEARKAVAYAAMNGFHRHLKDERKKKTLSRQTSVSSEIQFDSSAIDSAARDAIRCLEHALVVVAGEKSMYKCVVSPTSSHTHDESRVSNDYKDALLASYNHVVAGVIDRIMDIIETVFLKDAGVAGHKSLNNGDEDEWDHHQVRIAGSGAAAGLRILDGVRMLGPSLAKLCDMGESQAKQSQSHLHPSLQQNDKSENKKGETVAGSLCICIHRLTVKNTAKVMENLAKAIQNDPQEGDKFCPPDARVTAVTSDTCWAISLIAPFISAYRSVTKRRALPWDSSIGEDASDMDSFVKYLISRLLNNLQAKAHGYQHDIVPGAHAKSNLFIMNNTFYLLEYQSKTVAKLSKDTDVEEDEHYILSSSWFREKVGKLFNNAKQQYLSEWENLNRHLTSVDKNDLTYQSDKLLSLESGRLIKTRFSGFTEDLEKTYSLHKQWTFADIKLRTMLRKEVKAVFLPRYTKFFEKYSKLQFSKKKMDEYLKYPPKRVEQMIDTLLSN